MASFGPAQTTVDYELIDFGLVTEGRVNLVPLFLEIMMPKLSKDERTTLAIKELSRAARVNFGELAGFGRMIRQGDNEETRRYGLTNWYLRPLYVRRDLVFVECYIQDAARWVGCPNCPDAYLVKVGSKVRRFRDYSRALRQAAISLRRLETPNVDEQ